MPMMTINVIDPLPVITVGPFTLYDSIVAVGEGEIVTKQIEIQNVGAHTPIDFLQITVEESVDPSVKVTPVPYDPYAIYEPPKQLCRWTDQHHQLHVAPHLPLLPFSRKKLVLPLLIHGLPNTFVFSFFFFSFESWC